MIFNYFFLLPENFLLFCFFFIFTYFILSNYTEEHSSLLEMLVKLILINYLLISICSLDFTYALKDIFLKDNFNSFLIVFNIIMFFIFFSCTFNLLKYNKLNTFEYSMFLVLVLLGLNYFLYAQNLIVLYLLLEFFSLIFYVLTAYQKKNKYSFEAGLKYFILGSFSSILLLFGIVIIYGVTGSFYLEDLFIFFINLDNINISISLQSILSFGASLMLIGFLFKLYAFPFHFWVPDIYQGAPFITAFFFATIPFISIFYIFLKLYFYIYFFFAEQFFLFFLFSSFFSMLIGTFGAIKQKKFRRLMAYSSITTTGYYLILFLFPDFLMLKNIFFFIYIYIFNIFGLFLSFSTLMSNKENIYIERFTLLNGFIKRNDLLAFIIILFFFSVAGLPPFPSFLSKLYLLTYLYINNLYFFFSFIICITILSFYYYIRISKVILYNELDSKSVFFSLNKMSYIQALFIIYFTFFNILLMFKAEYLLNIIEYLILDFFI